MIHLAVLVLMATCVFAQGFDPEAEHWSGTDQWTRVAGHWVESGQVRETPDGEWRKVSADFKSNWILEHKDLTRA
jgi:hypothetical protein